MHLRRRRKNRHFALFAASVAGAIAFAIAWSTVAAKPDMKIRIAEFNDMEVLCELFHQLGYANTRILH